MPSMNLQLKMTHGAIVDLQVEKIVSIDGVPFDNLIGPSQMIPDALDHIIEQLTSIKTDTEKLAKQLG